MDFGYRFNGFVGEILRELSWERLAAAVLRRVFFLFVVAVRRIFNIASQSFAGGLPSAPTASHFGN